MRLSLGLCLPRDAASVPLVRRVAAQALRSVGFHPDDVADLELALTEAASNVLRHSAEGDEYEVRLELTDVEIVLEIVDSGHGFDGEDLGREHAAITAEAGRGIQLMRALVDDVRFNYHPGRGSVVAMTKTLRLDGSSPLGMLIAAEQAELTAPS